MLKGLETAEVVTKYYLATFGPSAGRMSRLVALRRAGTLYWVGTDHLGSTIRVADSGFNAVDGMRYRPYGGSRDAGHNLKTDHKFTGQIEDASIGLYWYNSRAYDPYLNRFASPDTVVPDPGNPQALNRYSYAYNNPLRYIDPSGHAAEDLQYLVPGWYDQAWQDEFVRNHGRGPEAGDYVYRFVTMGIANSYSGEDIMRSATIAIGAGLSPTGPALWSQPVDQTGLAEESARWQQPHPGGYGWIRSPEDKDRDSFGSKFTEFRWGKVRIIMGAEGSVGALVRLLGGGGDNATTFSANLIVFTKRLDFGDPRHRWWLMHELRHVMQAQELGASYLPKYIALSVVGHANNPMERDANKFANGAGTGAPDRWD